MFTLSGAPSTTSHFRYHTSVHFLDYYILSIKFIYIFIIVFPSIYDVTFSHLESNITSNIRRNP